MNKEDLRIVFMGTPNFAVESLRLLVQNSYNVVGVITMPDKPAGRGHKIQYSPVKEYALAQNLPLLQPEKLKDEAFLEQLKAWNATLQIVVAFRMLPELVWDMPSQGTFNLHASLLPQYRGAAPINWAIINGEKETGATTFFLTHEIDTGRVILQEKVPIEQKDNVGIVHDRLMTMGAELVCKTVDLIIENKAESTPQEHLLTEIKELKSAPKLFKDTCHIDWNKSVVDIYNFIRGLSPHPAAWTELHHADGRVLTVKMYATRMSQVVHQLPVGSLQTDGKKTLTVACADGFITIEEIQFPGKKRMLTEEFLRGYKFQEGAFFK
ncbi:MAG: hypothetical protein RL662_116 [Bacteroidota bacterium]